MIGSGSVSGFKRLTFRLFRMRGVHQIVKLDRICEIAPHANKPEAQSETEASNASEGLTLGADDFSRRREGHHTARSGKDLRIDHSGDSHICAGELRLHPTVDLRSIHHEDGVAAITRVNQAVRLREGRALEGRAGGGVADLGQAAIGAGAVHTPPEEITGDSHLEENNQSK